MGRTLEMLEGENVQRVTLSSEERDWWAAELRGQGSSGVRDRGDSEAGVDQWGSTLPGHGGT